MSYSGFPIKSQAELGHGARAGGNKYSDTTVCGEISKTDSEHDARAGSVKFTDTKVCREISKTDLDTMAYHRIGAFTIPAQEAFRGKMVLQPMVIIKGES